MSNFFNRFFKGDTIIWIIIVALAVISIIGVYSSTGTLAFKYQDGNTSHYILKHVTFILSGIAIIWAVHNIHYKIFSYASVIFLPISIIILILTLFIGDNINGGARWLTIFGISFQPSEIAKIALIIFTARRLSREQGEGGNPARAFKPIMIATGIVCGLIFSQNLSTAILIGGIIMLLMFIGRIPIKYLASTVGGGIALIVILVFAGGKFPDAPILGRFSTWEKRIATFFSPEEASSDASYQSDQAKIAISTGGLFGKFFGNSRQSNYLPHPYSDYIYAIIVEEGGIATGAFVILLYLTLLYRAIYTASRCKTSFPLFLITGLTCALVLQAFAHIFVCVGLFPVTGQTLPFVSMGGTSLILTAVSLGMILSVTRYGIAPKNEEPAAEFEPNEEMNELTAHDIQNLSNQEVNTTL